MPQKAAGNYTFYFNMLIFMMISAVSLYAFFRQAPFKVPAQYPGLDKAIHVALFSLLTGHILQWINRPAAKWAGCVGVIGFALASEYAQAMWLPQRDFSLEDLAANITGVVVGISLYWLYRTRHPFARRP